MRRKSRTLRPVEEEEEGVGGDGGAVAETAGPAVDALVQSNFVHKGGNARISSHLAPQGRPDSGPKKPEAGDASLSGLRAGGDGGGFFGPVRRHFTTLLRENAHKTVGDYYMAIFSIDFICFVYMMFGYSYMFETQNDSTKILSWWQSNYIGGNHLLSLMIMFLGIIGDRVVYLRRSMVGKLGIQYLSVLGYHYWLFWETNTGTRNVGKGFYFLKCIYFLLSGIQIRTGYPLYTTGQYLLRQYSTGGLVLFTIYENIPFLWLTRTLLDWAVVPTSLEIFQYFRFIDIYLWLYRNRAVNYSRGLFRRRLGQKRFWFPRVYQGLGLALLCGLLLFLPFILFSFLNPFYAQRALFESKLDVDFVDSGSTYRAFSRSTGTDRLPKKGPDGGRLAVFERVYGVKTVLRENEALFLAQFSALSESLWQPVASDVEMLIQSLESDDNKPLLQFTLASMTDTQIFRTFESLELSDESRSKIARALRASEPFAVRMNTTLSKHLILASGSKQFESAENNAANKGTCLRLVYASRDAARPIAFWSMEDCVSDCVCEKIDATAGGPAELAANFSIKQHSVQVLLQVANVSSFQFGGGTILTVYAAILFTVASLAKRLLSNKRLIVPFIDMPYTLHLYQLVLDIVYARQDKDFVMEEILYNGLIDIYRDPSELVKWSGQRALKTEDEWWADEGRTKIEGYDGCPSFRETLTEPYFERIVE
jgi:piezo-type mechanosensitive ion channel component 1/2